MLKQAIFENCHHELHSQSWHNPHSREVANLVVSPVTAQNDIKDIVQEVHMTSAILGCDWIDSNVCDLLFSEGCSNIGCAVMMATLIDSLSQLESRTWTQLLQD